MDNTQSQPGKSDNLLLMAGLFVIGYPLIQILVSILLAVGAETMGKEFSYLGFYANIIAISIAVLALCVWLERQHDFNRIGFQPSLLSIPDNLILLTGVLIAVLVFGYAYDMLLPTDGQPETEAVIILAGKELGSFSSTLMLLSIALFAPVIEEIIFRGYLQTALKERVGVWKAIIISALIFAVAHFDLDTMPLLFAIGVALGFVFHRTKSLYPAMILHGTNNSISCMVLIFAPELYHDRYAAFISYVLER